MESVAKRDELRQAGLAQFTDGTQETRDEGLAPFACFMFLQQQVQSRCLKR